MCVFYALLATILMVSTPQKLRASVVARAAASARQLKYYYAQRARQTPQERQQFNARQRERYNAKNYPAGRPDADPRLAKSTALVAAPPALSAEAAQRQQLARELRCRQLERDQLDAEINRLGQQLAALSPPNA